MALFKSRAAEDIETVQAKLAAARDAVPALESELAERSLDAALSGDMAATADVQRRLRDARERVELLTLAATKAQQVEDKRLADARSAAEKARHRSIAQKLAAQQSTIEAWVASVEAMHSAWSAVANTSTKAWASFTTQERQTSALYLDPDRLLQRANDELHRLAIGWARREDQAAMVTPRLPGIPVFAVRTLSKATSMAQDFEANAKYIGDVFSGKISRPKTVEEADAARIARLRAHPPVAASPIEVISVLTGWPIAASKAEFDAAVNARHAATVADERAEAQLEQFGRVLPPELAKPTGPTPFSEIAVDRSPEGMAALAAKVRDLVGDSEPDDEGTQP